MNKFDLDYKVLLEIDNLMQEKIHPSIVRIAKGVGKEKSLNLVLNTTNDLQEKGFIIKDDKNKIIGITNKGKTLLGQQDVVLKNKLNFFKIPVVGSISCGGPNYAYEDIKGEIALSDEIIRGDYTKYFILEADGDSMNNYITPINEGDYLLIKKQNFASNGDVVIALLDNEEATLKEFRRNDFGYVKLIPHSTNDIHKPFIITENLVIQGVLEKNLGQF